MVAGLLTLVLSAGVEVASHKAFIAMGSPAASVTVNQASPSSSTTSSLHAGTGVASVTYHDDGQSSGDN
jgi:hypothetical protein